ncbi:MAG: cytochrome P450 [Kineosporiaceae bacterium]|nr:cytochrome P450 [Kineosporiaceae bacterium]
MTALLARVVPGNPLSAPGPSPLTLVRSLARIRRDPIGFLEDQVALHGDLVSLPIPGQPVLVVNDPAGARRVLQDNPGGYTKATIQYGSLSTVTGIGLLTADGDQWKARRRVVQPAFHHGKLETVADAAAAAGARLRARWDAAPGQVLDADEALLHSMLELVGHTLFGVELAGPVGNRPSEGAGDRSVPAPTPDGERMVAAADVALRMVMARSQSGRPAWADPIRSARLRVAIATLDEVCAQIVAARRRRDAAGTGGSDDVLGLLLAAQDSGAMSATEVRDEMVTTVIAGHETVASALTWTLHLLSTHPEVAERLAVELDDVLGAGDVRPGDAPPGAGHRLPTWDDLHRLTYTRAVFDEALRLYPPAWVITRRASAPDVICGVGIPAGTLVVISPWLLQRREATWPEPTRFDPERFLLPVPGGAARAARPRGDYLPFGLGPRLCIGRDLALVEGPLLLACLLPGRRVVPVRTEAPVVDALITLRPRGGLALRLTDEHDTSGF